MKQFMYRLISRNRRSRLIRFFYRLCRTYVQAYHNKNNDHRVNGEFWLMRQIASVNPAVVFDVGANVGRWSSQSLSAFPSAVIHAFEPITPVFRQLKANVNSDRLILNNAALGDQNTKVWFNYYPDQTLFSSRFDFVRDYVSERIEVDQISGDHYCTVNQIKQIDFLKIDAEGSEHLVLDGFQKMLKSRLIRVIQFEYGVISIDTKFLLKDYFTLLNGYGYRVGKLYPNYVGFCNYHPRMEDFMGPNFVAVRDNDDIVTYLRNGLPIRCIT